MIMGGRIDRSWYNFNVFEMSESPFGDTAIPPIEKEKKRERETEREVERRLEHFEASPSHHDSMFTFSQ